jgi:hypothetical protein
MKRYTILASITEACGVGDPDNVLVDKTVDVGEHIDLEKLARSVLMEELGLRDLVYAEVRQTVRQRIWRACGLADSPPADDAEMAAHLLGAGAVCVGAEIPRENLDRIANSIRHKLLRLDNSDVRWEDPASAAAFEPVSTRSPVEVRILKVAHGPEAAVFTTAMLATRARELAEFERGRREGEQAERRKLWALLKLEGEPSENSGHFVIRALDQFARRRLNELGHDEAEDGVEPERHEYVRAFHCGSPGVVLRSEALARAVARLEGWSEPSGVRYLRWLDSSKAKTDDWFQECIEPPSFALTEEQEQDHERGVMEAMDARDADGVVEALHAVIEKCRTSDARISQVEIPTDIDGQPYTANDAKSVRQDVVLFLRPVLANLRAAMGLPALEQKPVHQHELYAELHRLTINIQAAREVACWLAAWNAQALGVREYLQGRLAERGGRGFDLVSLLAVWARYWKDRVSPEVAAEIESFALKLYDV